MNVTKKNRLGSFFLSLSIALGFAIGGAAEVDRRFSFDTPLNQNGFNPGFQAEGLGFDLNIDIEEVVESP